MTIKPHSDGSRKNQIREEHETISRKLSAFYDSIKEEAIPDRFLDLLEKLDAADHAHQVSAALKGDGNG